MRCRRLLSSAAATLLLSSSSLLLTTPADALPDPAPQVLTATTVPTTTSDPVAGATDGESSTSSSGGLLDISGHVRDAINDWFSSLVTSAVAPAIALLGQALFAAPDLTTQSQVKDIWLTTLVIANSLAVLFALIGGVLVMSHDSIQSQYSVKDVAPRLVLGVVGANISLILISQAIALSNGLSLGILGSVGDPATAVSGFSQVILGSLSGGGFLVIIALVATVLTLILVCVALIRAVLVVLLIAVAPLALLCHALPQSDGLAQLWWRTLCACLIVQVAQALVMLVAVRVLFVTGGGSALGLDASGLIGLLLAVCVLWTMVKIPTWAEQMVFKSQGPVNRGQQRVWNAARLAVIAA